MYAEAKKARMAMKDKAKRLASETSQKVDSSDWTPPELLNAQAKTGMRPVSRRAFKSGGKVEGEKAKASMCRAPRKSGGKTEAKQWMNAKINRNVKDANEEREGIKHVGGMKKGGRTEKQGGGGMYNRVAAKYTPKESMEETIAKRQSTLANIERQMGTRPDEVPDRYYGQGVTPDPGYKKGGRTAKQNGGGMSSGRGILTKGGKDVVGPTSMPATEEKKAPPIPQRPQRPPEKGMSGDEAAKFMESRKSGGRAKKMMGGAMMDPRLGMVDPNTFKFGQNTVTPGVSPMKKGGKITAKKEAYTALRAQGGTQVMEKGGKAGHPDVALDKALIKKMVKPEARTGKKEGGFLRTLADRVVGDLASDEAMKLKDKIMEGISGNKSGGRVKKNIGGALGGLADSGLGGLIPMAMNSFGKKDKDDEAEGKARGGKAKAKGKTNINIVIAAGKQGQDMGMTPPGGPTPPPGMDGGPGGVPVPVPPPQQAPQGMPMPMPMPMPMAAPTAGGAPMPRKDGGRITKVAKSYRDMEAGAASGEGRLQKTDMAKRIPKPRENGMNVYEGKGYPNKVPGATGGRTAHKAGGKVYRSYKDMDAGAGSGMGRLEKTEIQARKG
jgi:hypothetical protein